MKWYLHTQPHTLTHTYVYQQMQVEKKTQTLESMEMVNGIGGQWNWNWMGWHDTRACFKKPFISEQNNMYTDNSQGKHPLIVFHSRSFTICIKIK